MNRAASICKNVENTLANSFLIIGFSITNLPFPGAAAYFKIAAANDVSFYFGVVSHDTKFKLIKKRNQKDDSND